MRLGKFSAFIFLLALLSFFFRVIHLPNLVMFSRLHLVVIAALALFLKGSAGFHITIVVSVCKETNVDAVLSPFLDKIALSPHRHSSEVLFFCKCTKDRTVSGRLCANLPNVGRESSTYLSFILESYRYLSASQEHVILFINGGSGSKEHAALDIRTMARSLSESNVSPSYIDGGVRTASRRRHTIPCTVVCATAYDC